eukprot:249098_1
MELLLAHLSPFFTLIILLDHAVDCHCLLLFGVGISLLSHTRLLFCTNLITDKMHHRRLHAYSYSSLVFIITMNDLLCHISPHNTQSIRRQNTHSLSLSASIYHVFTAYTTFDEWLAVSLPSFVT